MFNNKKDIRELGPLEDFLRHKTRDRLAAKYIRGELYHFGAQLDHLKKAVTKTSDSWYPEKIAEDIIKDLTQPAEMYHYEADFLAADSLLKEMLNKKIHEFWPDFYDTPFELVDLAESGELKKLTGYIDQLLNNVLFM